MQGIQEWLTPQSLSGWAVALLMAATLFYQWRRGRIRPSKIVVFEANRTLFTKLPEAEKRLSMAFNGREIESLAMIDLAVRNEGASTIENIHFKVEVDEPVRILAVQPQITPPGVMIDYAESDPNTWAITIGYLNPVALLKEQVRLAVFCEPEPGEIDARGGGKGWALEFLDRAELEARKARSERMRSLVLIPFLVLTFAWIGGVMTFSPFLEDRVFGPPPEWWKPILLIATEIGLVLAGIFVIALIFDPIMKHLSKPYAD